MDYETVTLVALVLFVESQPAKSMDNDTPPKG